MKLLRGIVFTFYGSWCFLVFLVFMLVCSPFVILPLWINEKYGGRLAFWVLKFWGVGFSAFCGIFYLRQNRHWLKPEESYVFVANHSSFLDSPAITWAIPYQFRALGKKEILNLPVFGFVFRFIGITVDRTSSQSKQKSLHDIRNALNKGIHIAIFPEGTTNTGPEPLIEFHNGAFMAAIDTQKPIVPMVITNARHIFPYGSWIIKPGLIKIVLSEPIPTEGMTIRDTFALKKQVYERMEALVYEHDPVFKKLKH
ncbi:MAG: 1-acyl-sn-glycerol-3-phosphate acyltransferase [Cytophagales bacterium]|nr:MAG: 1-acyl-sn-glycerol-3-phosphate acyltransferase [Cytophagales bacterium]TAF59764.1 MAG: 1-acyl-sn-glycerol-3-phosphate acyltransferase [Cytophagales bacterium]